MEECRKQFVEVFEKKLCSITATCSACNIARQTYYRWYDTDDEFHQAIEDTKEGLIDFAETKLLEKINDGDTSSIHFYLRTKGRDRGYVTKTEISGAKGFNITVADEKAKEALENL